VLAVACSSASSGSIAAPVATAAFSASATVSVSAPVTVSASASVSAPAPVSASASVEAPPPPAPPAPKLVLHLGDSMVGGYGGLTKALETKFKERGTKLVRDWQVSVSILTFDHETKLQELLAKYSPDVVILTLGANDVFDPFPGSLAGTVRSIARKMSAGGRACYWTAPPIWKKDTGIVDVIKNNAAPCKVFDASYMKIARAGDGIHPTDSGGVTWAEGFFSYFDGTGPATPNDPNAP
jgi:acyl-CoA thioesterase-1